MSNENALEGPVNPRQPKAARAFWRSMATFSMGAVIMAAGVLIGARYRQTTQPPPSDGPRIVAWAVCDVATADTNPIASLRGSFNIRSAERVGSGRIRFAFETAMESDHYAIVASSGTAHITVDRRGTEEFHLTQTTAVGNMLDDGEMYVVVIANR